jgi:hypothetical protein
VSEGELLCAPLRSKIFEERVLAAQRPLLSVCHGVVEEHLQVVLGDASDRRVQELEIVSDDADDVLQVGEVIEGFEGPLCVLVERGPFYRSHAVVVALRGLVAEEERRGPLPEAPPWAGDRDRVGLNRSRCLWGECCIHSVMPPRVLSLDCCCWHLTVSVPR